MSKSYLLRIDEKNKKILELGAAMKNTSVQKLITEYGIQEAVNRILKEYPQIDKMVNKGK